MSSVTSSITSSHRRRPKRMALLASAVLFAATLAVGGGLAANAAPAPILNTNTAVAGNSLVVTVSGFAANESLTINLDTAATTLNTGSADTTGNYSTGVIIPAGTSLGSHTINVVGTSSATQSEAITVIAAPTATPEPASITASAFTTTGVKVTFSGFTPGDVVHFGGGLAQGGGGDFAAAPVTVGASGVVTYTVTSADYSGYFTNGVVTLGDYNVLAMSNAGNATSQFAVFTVTADPATPVKGKASFTG